jgi:hypothetical protein
MFWLGLLALIVMIPALFGVYIWYELDRERVNALPDLADRSTTDIGGTHV